MFLFVTFPVNTDAPVYHFPFATIGVIVANVLVFSLQIIAWTAGDEGLVDAFILDTGEFNPLTWLTSIYMHGGILHILFNMIFLWVFGLVVEGKVGWWRFLLIYHMIGIGESAFSQLSGLVFGSSVDCLGASGAIMGLVAIGLIWAPVNEIIMAWLVIVIIRPFYGTFEIMLCFVALIYFGMDLVSATISGFSFSSSLFHVQGFLFGAGMGYIFLRKKWVDCEGFDVETTINKHLYPEKHQAKLDEKERARIAVVQAQKKQEQKEIADTGIARVRQYVEAGHYEMALKRFAVIKKSDDSFRWPQEMLHKVVEGLCKKKNWTSAVPAMLTYAKDFPKSRAKMRLTAAQIMVQHLEQPSEAIDLLKSLSKSELSESEKNLAIRVHKVAKKMIRDGTLEIRKEP